MSEGTIGGVPMNEAELVQSWKNEDGTFGHRHLSLESVRAESARCGRQPRCKCWRHRVLAAEDLRLWEEDL